MASPELEVESCLSSDETEKLLEPEAASVQVNEDEATSIGNREEVNLEPEDSASSYDVSIWGRLVAYIQSTLS